MAQIRSLKFLLAAWLVLAPWGARSALAFELSVSSQPDSALADTIRAVSLTASARQENSQDPQEILAAAKADYQRILSVLYKNAYFGGTISIRIDGREASDLPPFYIPETVRSVRISVTTGPAFSFARATLAPLAPGTDLPDGFASGLPAHTTIISKAVDTAVSAWRSQAHAKAGVESQSIVADHRRATLDADIRLAPGPVVRFGRLSIAPGSNVRAARIRQIAGYPVGELYSPEILDRVARRLRKTGAFRTVALQEADELAPGNTLPVTLVVADQRPRRFGFGAEVHSQEGASVSAFWLHRNMFGGAERLRFEGEVSGIRGIDPLDYRLSGKLLRPGSGSPLNNAYLAFELRNENEPRYSSRSAFAEVGLERTLSDRVTGTIAMNYRFSEFDDALGQRQFSHLSLPITGRFDGRDDILNPRGGTYLAAEITPFIGLEASASGTAVKLDARSYLSFGNDDVLTLAGRLQAGSIIGPDAAATPPDLLFYSGGGGTVRGQPYKSLDVDLGGGVRTGGRNFLGASIELRARINKDFSIVAFADQGFVGLSSVPGRDGQWHGGAGLGVRYDTGIGPIRLDLAVPTNGPGSGGLQFYVGIGQAF